MILGYGGLANYRGLQSSDVPVTSGNRVHHSARTTTVNSGSKLARLKDGWIAYGPLYPGTPTRTLLVDLQGTGKEKVTCNINACLDTRGISLYIDLPCSPCKGLGDRAYSENPLGFHSGGAGTSPTKGGSHCLKSKSHEILGCQHFCGGLSVNRKSDNHLDGSSDGVNSSDLIDSNPGPEVQETFKAMPSLECHTMSIKDGLMEGILSRGERKHAEPNLTTDSHGNFKIFTEGLPSPVRVEKPGAVIPSNMGTQGLRIVPEVDNVQSLKRKRLMTPIDVNQNVEDVVASLDGLVDSESLRSSHEQLKTLRQRDLSSATLGISKTTMFSTLGTPLRAVLEADDVQRSRKRWQSTLVKETTQISNEKHPDIVDEVSNMLSVFKETSCLSESGVLSDTGELVVSKYVHQRDNRHETAGKDWKRSGVYSSDRISSELTKNKKSRDGYSSTTGRSPTYSSDEDSLNKYVGRSSEFTEPLNNIFEPGKVEWSAQHHPYLVESAIAEAGFAGNVGGSYQSAIDKRPAAPHPGFVGDGTAVQHCIVCGEREDATNSLICDSCEEVYHMTCVNVRMKIVPRVDDWLCQPCRRKRKMSRESENQWNPGSGAEPKDWWREDAGVGGIEREMLRMSNGRRMKVRIGPNFQAEVPDWTGIVDKNRLHSPLAETGHGLGQEIPLTYDEKKQEQDLAEFKLENNIWPKGWSPALNKLPSGFHENWLQCMVVLYDEGEICPDGRKADRDIICGKWRRAPCHMKSNKNWDCSCALVWDPRHGDCAVPQELSTEEVNDRMKLHGNMCTGHNCVGNCVGHWPRS